MPGSCATDVRLLLLAPPRRWVLRNQRPRRHRAASGPLRMSLLRSRGSARTHDFHAARVLPRYWTSPKPLRDESDLSTQNRSQTLIPSSASKCARRDSWRHAKHAGIQKHQSRSASRFAASKPNGKQATKAWQASRLMSASQKVSRRYFRIWLLAPSPSYSGRARGSHALGLLAARLACH